MHCGGDVTNHPSIQLCFHFDDGLIHLVSFIEHNKPCDVGKRVWAYTWCSATRRAPEGPEARYGRIVDKKPTCLECLVRVQ